MGRPRYAGRRLPGHAAGQARWLVAWSVVLSLLALAISAQMTSQGVASLRGTFTGMARVVDGDTLHVAGQRIRLRQIDAPEQGQLCRGGPPGLVNCGQAATLHMAALVRGAPVRCVGAGRDHYGRILATCWANGRDVGRALVDAGYARAYVRYGYSYLPAELAARMAGRGLWQTRWQAPWDYRAARRRT